MSTENQNLPAIEKVKKDITAKVLSKINAFQDSGELRLPPDYSAENALKSAYLILLETKNKENKFALEHCTEESVANALLKMVVWGLSPLKKQCDFIMYGNQLECGIEYTGNMVLAKRFGGLKDIKANAILEGDDFVFEVDITTGKRKLVKHTQTLENIGNKNVVGAYAVITMADGSTDVEIMNMVQIRDAWNQGAMKGNSPAHKNFPDQMACKTVINRACKLLIRASDDAVLYNKEDDEPKDYADEDTKHEIKEKANKTLLVFDEATVVDTKINGKSDEPKKSEPKDEPKAEADKKQDAEEQPNF